MVELKKLMRKLTALLPLICAFIIEIFKSNKYIQVINDSIPAVILGALGILFVLVDAIFGKLEELRVKQNDIDHKIECGSVDKVFNPLDHYKKNDQLLNDIKRADEIWILTRTCIKWMRDWGSTLKDVFSREKEKVKIVVLNPDNSFKYYAQMDSVWTNHNTDLEAYGETYRKTLVEIMKCRNKKNKLELRFTDFLAPWTIIAINPYSSDGVIYVEMKDSGNYQTKLAKPTMRITRSDSDSWHFFTMEFMNIWSKSDYKEIEVESGDKVTA